MAVSTVSTEAELISEYWNNVFLTNLRENLTFYDYAKKSTQGRGQGVMCHWMQLYDMTAVPSTISEGSDPDETTLSAKDITANVGQYGASVLLSDILQATWVGGSYAELMGNLARNAALTLDTIVRNGVFSAGGSAQYGGTAVARNSIATDGSFDADIAEIREAVHSLEKNKVRTYPDGFYRAIVNEDTKYDLQGDTASWQDIVKHYDPSMLKERFTGMTPGGRGEVGEIFGTRFILSQLALLLDVSGSASTDVYQSYIFGPEYFGISQLQDVQIIVKNPHPASDLNLYGSVGWKCGFAYKELDSARMIRLESGSSMGD